MYAIRDKNGNAFKWSKKGKNRECWIKDKKCITKECFIPENCGTINEKTQEKNILGMCQTYFNGICPMGYHSDDKCPITIDKIIIIEKDDKDRKEKIDKDRKEKIDKDRKEKIDNNKSNINNNNNTKANSYQTKSYYKKMKKRRNYE